MYCNCYQLRFYLYMFHVMFQFKLPFVSRQSEEIFNSCLEKLVCTVDAMSYGLGIEKECIFNREVCYYEDI